MDEFIKPCPSALTFIDVFAISKEVNYAHWQFRTEIAQTTSENVQQPHSWRPECQCSQTLPHSDPNLQLVAVSADAGVPTTEHMRCLLTNTCVPPNKTTYQVCTQKVKRERYGDVLQSTDTVHTEI